MLEDNFKPDLVIKRSELPKYLKKYSCDTEKELNRKLWCDYGIDLKVVED